MAVEKNAYPIVGRVLIEGLSDYVDMSTVQDYDSMTIAAGGSEQTWDLSMFDEMQFDFSGADASGLSVFTSKDGVSFSATARKPWDLATRAAAGGSVLSDGEYLLELNCKTVKFVNNGATAVTLHWSAKATQRAR